MEPAAPAGVQQYPRKEFHQSLQTTWVGHVHQPRELGKRWRTLVDRRVMVVTLTETMARVWGITRTYSFGFEYYFDSDLNQIVFDYDHNLFTMRWPPSLVVETFDTGRDVAVPAIVTAAASAANSLVCTFIWGARMRRDWNVITGMGLFELTLVTAAGSILRLDPLVYSWRFEPRE